MHDAKFLLERFSYDKLTGTFFSNKTKKNVGHVSNGYVRIKLNKKEKIPAHRLAWLLTYGAFPEGSIDHINGNPLDNRICNLRIANASENGQNQRKPRKDNTSGYLGVYFHTHSNKYMAKIMINNKYKYLGIYTTAEEASKAYLEAKRRLHPFCTI